MSEVVDEAFDSASKRVDESHDEAVAELKSKVEKAKSAALKKLSS